MRIGKEIEMVAEKLIGQEEPKRPSMEDLDLPVEKIVLTQEVVDSIDWDGLKRLIARACGTMIDFTVKLESGRQGPRVDLESANLIKQAGIFQGPFKDVRLDFFNGGYITGDGKALYVDPHLRWESKDGGSNGKGILDAFWMFGAQEWKLRSSL